MREFSSSDGDWPLNRRSALKLTGGFLLASALGGQAAAVHDDGATQRVYRVKQGSREFEIDLLAGDTPVRELYDLRIPSYYSGNNGASDPGEGPYYESVGLSYLLAESSTVTFLYDGPDGVSLVVVHGGGSSGGSVTWRVTGVPSAATWLVKDDLYTYPESGEPAQSNYDRWDVGGSEHVVDWTWRNSQTDGGVLGYLDGDFSLTISPAYNEAATLYGEHYAGDVASWQVLTGGWDSLTRESLNLTEAVTISCETVDDPTTETPTEPVEDETPDPSEEEPAEQPEEGENESDSKDQPEWKEDRDAAREEWKEDRDEWQEKRDNGDDDWKEARDEALSERKKKRDEWQNKRDEAREGNEKPKKDKKPKKPKKSKKDKKPKKPKKGKKDKKDKKPKKPKKPKKGDDD